MRDHEVPLTHAEKVEKALDAFDALLSNPPSDEVESRRRWFGLGWLCRGLWEERER